MLPSGGPSGEVGSEPGFRSEPGDGPASLEAPPAGSANPEPSEARATSELGFRSEPGEGSGSSERACEADANFWWSATTTTLSVMHDTVDKDVRDQWYAANAEDSQPTDPDHDPTAASSQGPPPKGLRCRRTTG